MSQATLPGVQMISGLVSRSVSRSVMCDSLRVMARNFLAIRLLPAELANRLWRCACQFSGVQSLLSGGKLGSPSGITRAAVETAHSLMSSVDLRQTERKH